MRHTGATGDLRLKRILIIHKKLRSMKNFSAIQFEEACREVDSNVTPRRIQSDLKFLREELQAPIDKTTKHRGYSYSEPFSLFDGLDNTYSANLNEVLALVRQMTKWKNEFIGLEDLLLRLEQRAVQIGAESNPTILFETPEYSGQRHLISLYKAISAKTFLVIDYQPFSYQKQYQRKVFPLLLKEYNRRWFLIAQEVDKPVFQILALDRIISFRETKVPFPLFDKIPSDYFDSIVGVSHEQDSVGIEKIVLLVHPSRIDYLKTKKIHISQREEQMQDGFWRLTLQIEPNRELTAMLLSFGADIEVIEPLSLRNRIAEDLRLAWAHYKVE